MAVVMIGIDRHEASHTAVAISAAEEPLGELEVRACAAPAERLLAWASARPRRAWAVEGASGPGHLLARQPASSRPEDIALVHAYAHQHDHSLFSNPTRGTWPSA